MRSRITQLLARFIGAGALILATKLGLSDEQKVTLMQYVSEFAAWAVALGAFAIDLLIHRMETGAFTAPAGSAKTEGKKINPPGSRIPFPGLALLLLFVFWGVAGCNSISTASITDDETNTAAQPASLATMDNAGNQRAIFQGVGPTQLKQDDAGNWLTTPGQGGVMTYDPVSNRMYLWTPQDARLTNVAFTPSPAPGSPAFTADMIELNLSPVATVYMQQFQSAMDAIKDMTRAEAEAQVQKMQAAGEITANVAQVIIESVIPRLTP